MFRASALVTCAFFMLFLGYFLCFGVWLRVLLGECDYSFFLFGGRRVSTQRASESWQSLDEVARREQKGGRLVSVVVPPKLWAVEGKGYCLGFISGLDGEMV